MNPINTVSIHGLRPDITDMSFEELFKLRLIWQFLERIHFIQIQDSQIA